MASLADQAQAFASSLSETLNAVLPGDNTVEARQGDDSSRYLIQRFDANGTLQRIPLSVNGEPLAELTVQLYLELDTHGTFLKAVESKLAVYSILDTRQPLVRLEYVAGSGAAPSAHWHFHAERGSLTHLLTLSHAANPRDGDSPHTLASLHFPVGGERFRPCVEDFLEFLVRECGVDSEAGWDRAVKEGRTRWRRMQFRTVVRDLQSEAAEVLRNYGWNVTPPEGVTLTESQSTLTRW